MQCTEASRGEAEGLRRRNRVGERAFREHKIDGPVIAIVARLLRPRIEELRWPSILPGVAICARVGCSDEASTLRRRVLEYSVL